ncbi:MAG: class I SAM-dependent methyltransferase [Planctomycetota bacterium]
MPLSDSAGNGLSPRDRDATKCVFCDARELALKFTKPVLGRYRAEFFECRSCGSLQVSRPHWLDEAHCDVTVNPDAGLVQRGILCCLYIRAMRKVGLLPSGARIIDYGAGSGLLVRLLRDQGFDAFGCDKYSRPALCAPFTLERPAFDDGRPADLVTLVDVLEHLPDPRPVLSSISNALSDSGILLVRTPLYDAGAHGEDWEHLGCDHGRHVSFASRQALRIVARSLGLEPHLMPFNFFLLTRPGRRIGGIRKAFLSLLSGSYFCLAMGMGLCRFDRARKDALLLNPDYSRGARE